MKYARVFGLVIIVSLLATVPDVQVNAGQPGSVSFATVSNAGWSEVGVSSASGGGISNNNGISSDPSMVIAPDGTPYVAWSDESSGVWQIYVRRWDGSSWAEAGSGSATGGGISDNTGESSLPVMAIAPDGTPYVAWQDSSGGPRSIYIRRWNGSSWEEVGIGSASGRGISGSSGYASSPTIAIASNGVPYVAWTWGSGGFYEIHVRRWNGDAWQEVGTGSASNGGISNTYCAHFPSIAIGPTDAPYIAWKDDDCTHMYPQIYVRRWNGNSWAEVGSGSASGEGISDTVYWSSHPSLAIGPDGTPYVAWEDQGVYVRRWNGSTWGEIGLGSASGGGVGGGTYPSLAVAPDAKPYLTWTDWGPAFGEIYVRRWSGSVWEEVGEGSASGSGISDTDDYSYDPAIAAASGGAAYVAWEQTGTSGDCDIFVRQAPAELEVTPSVAFFLAEVDGANPDARSFTVTSSHSTIDWTATISPTVGWLSLSPALGTTPSVMTATASISGLGVNRYTTGIVVDGGPSALHSPRTIPVTLIVAEQIYTVHLPLALKGH